jgi:hypothetical protein
VCPAVHLRSSLVQMLQPDTARSGVNLDASEQSKELAVVKNELATKTVEHDDCDTTIANLEQECCTIWDRWKTHKLVSMSPTRELLITYAERSLCPDRRRDFFQTGHHRARGKTIPNASVPDSK